MIKVTAVFIGKNESCGYITNTTYILVVKQLDEGKVEINAHHRPETTVIYGSVISFLNNWKDVSIIHE